jgi:SAM-dependent methyltransferase
LGEWWISELADDPDYEAVVTPLLLEALIPVPGHRYLDLGCGEGRVKRAVEGRGGVVVGVDLNEGLAGLARRSVVGLVEHLPFRDDACDGAYAVLVLEHLTGIGSFFDETARVVRPGGALAIVMNHPLWTATGSTPIGDAEGEILWRPGAYFEEGHTDVAAGEHRVRFYHRPLGTILGTAAATGWSLESLVEGSHAEAIPEVPRLLACRWRLLP